MTDWAEAKAQEWLQKHFDAYDTDWENLEANLAALLREVVQKQLDDLYSDDPCPKCGHGISGECYGCRLEASKTRETRLREALSAIADPHVPDNIGLPESKLYLAQQIARVALATESE